MQIQKDKNRLIFFYFFLSIRGCSISLLLLCCTVSNFFLFSRQFHVPLSYIFSFPFFSRVQFPFFCLTFFLFFPCYVSFTFPCTFLLILPFLLSRSESKHWLPSHIFLLIIYFYFSLIFRIPFCSNFLCFQKTKNNIIILWIF